MSCCPNTIWGKHRFEARYDTKLSSAMTEIKATSPAYLEAAKDKAYVRDICVRCGETVERK